MGQMDRWEEEYQRLKGQREQSPSGVDVDIDQLTAKDIEMLRTISELRRKNLERLGAAAEKPREQIAQDLREQYLGGSKNPIKNFFKRLAWETGGGQQALQRSDKYYKENQDNFRFAKDDNADLIKMLATISKRDKDLKDNLNTQNKNITSVMKENAMDKYRQGVLTQGDERLDQGQERLRLLAEQIKAMQDPTRMLTGNMRNAGALQKMDPTMSQNIQQNARGLNFDDAQLKAASRPTTQMQAVTSTSQRPVTGVNMQGNPTQMYGMPSQTTSMRNVQGPPPIMNMNREGFINRGESLAPQQSLQSPPQQGLQQPGQPQAQMRPQVQKSFSPSTSPKSAARQVAENATRAVEAHKRGNEKDAEIILKTGKKYYIPPAGGAPGVFSFPKDFYKDGKAAENAGERGKVSWYGTQLAQHIVKGYVSGIADKAMGPQNNMLSAVEKMISEGPLISNIINKTGWLGQSGTGGGTKDPSFTYDNLFGEPANPNDVDVADFRATFKNISDPLAFAEQKLATGLAALGSEQSTIRQTIPGLVNGPKMGMLVGLAHALRVNLAEFLIKDRGYNPQQIIRLIGSSSAEDPIMRKVKEMYYRVEEARALKSRGKPIPEGLMPGPNDYDPEEILGEWLEAGGNTDNLPIRLERLGERKGPLPKGMTLEDEKRVLDIKRKLRNVTRGGM